MQYTFFILIAFFFAGVTMANQDWKMRKFGGIGGGDDMAHFDRFITHKRAINGELRRSSILWGKRAHASGLRNFERDIPLIPEDFMVMWPVESSEKTIKDENKFETTTILAKTSRQSLNQHETENEEVFSDDNLKMERVAKAGIRPKLQLSSRLWGR
ncbi:Neuropeptide-Like Protein [Caenorhabditis elegans]|uniref:Neuropeptide-Like Protein n=1 Tax=Caenorhabditis elegans TaxID=6239 RepID=Q17671_CAEEL|nr:Neuropeptide-Like Protein [Caenorhabditis elegans]CAA91788.2 Neuropeptide-Like Protein [Caenorhabditis elegans]|eukprot:NP_510153.2 Uncharacterized protein CELE_C05E7.3 [Caenorhabditis elegans]